MKNLFLAAILSLMIIPFISEAKNDNYDLNNLNGSYSYLIKGDFDNGVGLSGRATETGVLEADGTGLITAVAFSDTTSLDLSSAPFQGLATYICDYSLASSVGIYLVECDRSAASTGPDPIEIDFYISLGKDSVQIEAISNSGAFGVVDISGNGQRQ